MPKMERKGTSRRGSLDTGGEEKGKKEHGSKYGGKKKEFAGAIPGGIMMEKKEFVGLHERRRKGWGGNDS